jgi:uncharacterized protein with HEPN domain
MKTSFGAGQSSNRPVTSIPPRQVAYLLDIFKSVKAIQSYVAGQTAEEFLADPKTQDAVLRRFLVAGEAAARLTAETRAEFPQIPFPKIVGMRNRVVHDYGNVDFEIIWETVRAQLPPLFKELRRFFAGEGEV